MCSVTLAAVLCGSIRLSGACKVAGDRQDYRGAHCNGLLVSQNKHCSRITRREISRSPSKPNCLSSQEELR